ncbi:MAG: tRNA (cytidine(34)-2'-O)-methyltransferase [Nitrospirae bacterium]|nr:tRNA (cytidine(34)-2'-O)-methyltransferase [Nitrospirota bacterium]
MLHIALYQPEIPPNTGAIARQCVGMNARLHIIKPITFELSRGKAKRAGLDYWDDLKMTIHNDAGKFLLWLGKREPWLVTKKGILRYDKPCYKDEDIMIFGNETKGLPAEWLRQWAERTVSVPILGNVRSYNLANTVSILLAEASLKAGMYGGDGK